jgi:transposase InsO family protein
VTLLGLVKEETMPWKVSEIVSERMKFVMRLEEGERMTDLCKEFGISRKTGYKFWYRYRLGGPEALFDEPRRPAFHPSTTSEAIRKLVVDLRLKHPTWGPRKLKATLERKHPDLEIPAKSTIGDLLRKKGLVKPRSSRKRRKATPTSLSQSHAPNQIWCADFKGEFLLGNHKPCYPLTISDHYSRYLIACEGLEGTSTPAVKEVFEEAFRKYGMPAIIRTDNGSPFASTGLEGLTKLSVWWLRLGIILERIKPGHPEQNGRHERMHLTLKQETTRPAASNFLQQQERFDRFRKEYNLARPHEALGMRRPVEVYTTSCKQLPDVLPAPDYSLFDMTKTVGRDGHINLGGGSYFIGAALAGEQVGLREVRERYWLVCFLGKKLGYVNEQIGKMVDS